MYIRIVLILVIIIVNSSLLLPQNWIKLNSGSCYDIEVKGDSAIIASFSIALKYSEDNGNTWVNINSSTSEAEIERNELSGTIFLVNKYDKKIYKSADMGANWEVILDNHSSINKIVCEKGNLYAVDISGKFLISKNEGQSWDSSFVAPYASSIGITSAGQFFVGASKNLYSSIDTGKTWNLLNNEEINQFIYYISINSKDEIFIAIGNRILSSKDYGASWELVSNLYFLSGFLTIDEEDKLYAGTRSLYKSVDNGITWSSLIGNFQTHSLKSFKDKLYVATSHGLYKFDPSIPVYIGSNYLPLQLKNRWQYLVHSVGIGVHKYSLVEITIEKDTIINQLKYFKYGNYWTRYSEEDKKIYVYNDNHDKTYMDFNLPSIATFPYLDNLSRPASVFDGSQNLFGAVINFKGFYHGNNAYMPELTEESFGENFGRISTDYSSTEGPDGYSHSELIMAVIYDSTNTPMYFSNHYKPEINFLPVLKIDTTSLSLQFEVMHHYSDFFALNSPHIEMNFINSVCIEYYYSKEDSQTIHDTIDVSNIARTPQYQCKLALNIPLLQNGYKLNYKIIAKDKGIIPEISISPDSGYYQCIWDGVTGIIGQDYLKEFSLSQNYPNPFNPSTKIKFTIPDSPLLSKERGSLPAARHGGEVVSLKVYDVLGNEIATLINEEKPAGEYEVEFNASSLSSGIYFYKIQAGEFSKTKKLILMK